MNAHIFRILANVLTFILFQSSLCTNVYLKITTGLIKGKDLIDQNGNLFSAFQSIPYANPPVGLLRFNKPVEVANWTGIKDCTQDVPNCIQVTVNSEILGQEDCLYLNVYTNNTDNQDNLLPVFVFIHGGGWLQESSSIKRFGPHYLMTEPIVLVTMNYRLGPFGNVLPNIGLYDQQLALQWVQNNIKYFGGNPEKVTLGGESAGGMSAHYHLLTQPKQLFHQLISMSGTSLNPLAYIQLNFTQGLANQLGIKSQDLNTIVSTLQQLSVEDIINAFNAMQNTPAPTIDVPAIAGIYVDSSQLGNAYPMQILKSGNFQKVPLLIGFTNAETQWFKVLPWFSIMLDINKHIPFYLRNTSAVIKHIQTFYNISDSDVANKNVYNSDFWNDIWFKYHSYRAAKYHNTKDVYFYEFSAHTNLHYVKDYFNMTYNGAAHTDDLSYLFSNEFVTDIKIDSIEDRMIKKMVQIFTCFIRFGKPFLQQGKVWPRFTENVRSFVNISNNGLEVQQLPNDSFKFWDFIYDKYGPGYF